MAIGHKTTIGVFAITVWRPITRCAVLCLLDGVDEVGLFHLARDDAEFLGLLLYLGHCHAFFLFCLYGGHSLTPSNFLTVWTVFIFRSFCKGFITIFSPSSSKKRLLSISRQNTQKVFMMWRRQQTRPLYSKKREGPRAPIQLGSQPIDPKYQ